MYFKLRIYIYIYITYHKKDLFSLDSVLALSNDVSLISFVTLRHLHSSRGVILF